MIEFLTLTKRNIKIFFKDKGMFFASLITPIILLVLYVTFLSRVYRDSVTMSVPEGVTVPEKILNGFVGGELLSALLAVCCVTVAFSSNMVMVQDKAKGVISDLLISPVKKSLLALSYYAATFVSALIICFAAMILGMIYLACTGWYLSAADVFLIILDVLLLSLFGTAMSALINHFLSSQGQMSAVGTIVSAGYGFICGAYMPISQYGKALQNFLGFLPGTYGTSLIRNHSLEGTFDEMIDSGIPAEVVDKIKDSVDCNIYFFEHKASIGAMYGIMIGATVALIVAYILINVDWKAIVGRSQKTVAKENK